jgi:tetratricopeptide (TPR) repeat protein
MLRPKKKVTKREIKQDTLVTGFFEARRWYEENKKLVSTALTALAVLVIAVIVYTNNIRANNEKATVEVGKVMKYYDQGNYELAIHGNPAENIRGLQAIVDDYGNTSAGEFAKLYLANSYFFLKNYAKALGYYEDVDLDDPLLMASTYAGAAACLEAQGNYEEAARYYEKAAAQKTIESLIAENLHHAAMNYGMAGKKEKAIELFKRLKKQFPTSLYAADAERSIARFSS